MSILIRSQWWLLCSSKLDKIWRMFELNMYFIRIIEANMDKICISLSHPFSFHVCKWEIIIVVYTTNTTTTANPSAASHFTRKHFARTSYGSCDSCQRSQNAQNSNNIISYDLSLSTNEPTKSLVHETYHENILAPRRQLQANACTRIRIEFDWCSMLMFNTRVYCHYYTFRASALLFHCVTN